MMKRWLSLLTIFNLTIHILVVALEMEQKGTALKMVDHQADAKVATSNSGNSVNVARNAVINNVDGNINVARNVNVNGNVNVARNDNANGNANAGLNIAGSGNANGNVNNALPGNRVAVASNNLNSGAAGSANVVNIAQVNIVRKAPNVLNQLQNLGRGAVAQKQADTNPYLSDFLSKHAKPEITMSGDTDFFLRIDSRYSFRPAVRLSPFRSFAQPWPHPQEYQSNPESVFHINPATFQIMILNKTSDILKDAIKRYTEIIMKRTLEEPYNFVNNFHESFEKYNVDDAKKYETAQPLPQLSVYVSGSDVGYPQLNYNETYSLVVRGGEARLDAGEVWGALRGLETFSQLVYRRRANQELYIRETSIRDFPRFSHRGILVDTARHYIHKDVLKQMMEAMVYNKMNVLHWHIVDDNAFPYASEVYPNLSAKGAAHPSMIYTLKDIRELVEYARLRGIRIVPEFDTPGHTLSWLGYPEIKSTCYAGSQPLAGPLGPIDPVKNETYSFMGKLFQEIYNVFPDQFVHLGGDELHSDCWATNPSIIKYLEQNAGIPSKEASYVRGYVDKAVGYYFKRLITKLKEVANIRRNGASFLMWEDVLKNTKDVPKDSILEVWYGKQTNVRDLNNKGYQALYSSCWYLDHTKYGTDWLKYYRCEPSPYVGESEEKGKLLGGEACMWAEYITSDSLMVTTWPRASAVAERLWSKKSQTDIVSASKRFQEQRCRMVYRGLQVGHSSGPDHCVLAETPYSVDQTIDGAFPNVMMNIGHHQIGLTMISQQSPNRSDNKVVTTPVVIPQLVSRDNAIAASPRHTGRQILNTINVNDEYLPVINLVLTCVGIYLMILASRYWRSRHRAHTVSPSNSPK